jgi:hypothetical protein
MIIQSATTTNDKFTSWKFSANSDAYLGGKKLGLNKDSSVFSIEQGQTKDLPSKRCGGTPDIDPRLLIRKVLMVLDYLRSIRFMKSYLEIVRD